MSRVHHYKGRHINVSFETGRCIHAAECLRALPEAFNARETPWVKPDAASAEAVMEAISRCPTGALKAEWVDGLRQEQADLTNRVDIIPNGPLYVRGRVRLLDAKDATIAEEFRVALCRCGASASKPFCDNRHRALPFADAGEIHGGMDLESSDTGELSVKAIPDGPLEVMGPLLIRDAQGRARYAGAETWLCRCGASQSKPFCDGSHATCGFRAG
jgi:CDGSH-type Zn-finger protein/uncharacterized Fe-S cluster protein YjdI